MSDDGWLRDKLFEHAADLGAQKARQEAADANIARIADEMHRGFAEIKTGFDGLRRQVHDDAAREGAHIRGEIKRLDENLTSKRKAEEEAAEAHSAQVISTLSEELQKSRRVNRLTILALLAAAVGANSLLENAPMLLHALGF